MTVRQANDKMEENQAGIIQLGVDGNDKLHVIPIRGNNETQMMDLLRSIDKSLKTLLKYNEIITDGKL